MDDRRGPEITKPVEREPLRGTYRGHEIITMPPPSSGGVAMIEMLNISKHYDLKSMGAGSSQAIHTMVEADSRAFADRAQFSEIPILSKFRDRLISRKYADKLAATIDPEHASTSQEVRMATLCLTNPRRRRISRSSIKTAMSRPTPIRSTTVSETRSRSKERAFCSTTRWTISRLNRARPTPTG